MVRQTSGLCLVHSIGANERVYVLLSENLSDNPIRYSRLLIHNLGDGALEPRFNPCHNNDFSYGMEHTDRATFQHPDMCITQLVGGMHTKNAGCQRPACLVVPDNEIEVCAAFDNVSVT